MKFFFFPLFLFELNLFFHYWDIWILPLLFIINYYNFLNCLFLLFFVRYGFGVGLINLELNFLGKDLFFEFDILFLILLILFFQKTGIFFTWKFSFLFPLLLILLTDPILLLILILSLILLLIEFFIEEKVIIFILTRPLDALSEYLFCIFNLKDNDFFFFN